MTDEQSARTSADPPTTILGFRPAPPGWWILYRVRGSLRGEACTHVFRTPVGGWFTVAGDQGPETHAGVADGIGLAPVLDVLGDDDQPELVHETEFGRCTCRSGDPMLSPDWWWCEVHGALSEDAPCPR